MCRATVEKSDVLFIGIGSRGLYVNRIREDFIAHFFRFFLNYKCGEICAIFEFKIAFVVDAIIRFLFRVIFCEMTGFSKSYKLIFFMR